MIRSKVRVEFTEESSPGIFNMVAKESGTEGDTNLGVDVAEAIKAAPRPLLELAKAIVYLYDFSNNRSTEPALLKAAKDYVAKWVKFDAAVAGGAKPQDLEWPG